MNKEPLVTTHGEGFAYFRWHCAQWPESGCNGHRWCFECTHDWRLKQVRETPAKDAS